MPHNKGAVAVTRCDLDLGYLTCCAEPSQHTREARQRCMDLRRKDLTGFHTHDAIAEDLTEPDKQFAVHVSRPQARFVPVREDGPGDSAPEGGRRKAMGDEKLFYLASLELKLSIMIAMLRDAPTTLFNVGATGRHTLRRRRANAFTLRKPDALAPAPHDRIDGLAGQGIAHDKLTLSRTCHVYPGTSEAVGAEGVDCHRVQRAHSTHDVRPARSPRLTSGRGPSRRANARPATCRAARRAGALE